MPLPIPCPRCHRMMNQHCRDRHEPCGWLTCANNLCGMRWLDARSGRMVEAGAETDE